jgi:AcrR family transcriptional regulator
MATGSPGVTRRERTREATRTEIKQTALDLMREQATTDVRFTDIARVMGLTPPALYRYYDDRDALLTEMITDGYHDLAAALAAARSAAGDAPAEQRLLAVGSAYRAWALEDPQRFALIFGMPVPGYAAPQDGPTVVAAKRAMANLADVVLTAAVDGSLGEPLIRAVGPHLVAELADGKNDMNQLVVDPADSGASADAAASPGEYPQPAPGAGVAVSAATHQAMLSCWAGMHGFVCLEAYGHLDWFSAQARQELFAAQLTLAALAMGIRPAAG